MPTTPGEREYIEAQVAQGVSRATAEAVARSLRAHGAWTADEEAIAQGVAPEVPELPEEPGLVPRPPGITEGPAPGELALEAEELGRQAYDRGRAMGLSEEEATGYANELYRDVRTAHPERLGEMMEAAWRAKDVPEEDTPAKQVLRAFGRGVVSLEGVPPERLHEETQRSFREATEARMEGARSFFAGWFERRDLGERPETPEIDVAREEVRRQRDVVAQRVQVGERDEETAKGLSALDAEDDRLTTEKFRVQHPDASAILEVVRANTVRKMARVEKYGRVLAHLSGAPPPEERRMGAGGAVERMGTSVPFQVASTMALGLTDPEGTKRRLGEAVEMMRTETPEEAAARQRLEEAGPAAVARAREWWEAVKEPVPVSKASPALDIATRALREQLAAVLEVEPTEVDIPEPQLPALGVEWLRFLERRTPIAAVEEAVLRQAAGPEAADELRALYRAAAGPENFEPVAPLIEDATDRDEAWAAIRKLTWQDLPREAGATLDVAAVVEHLRQHQEAATGPLAEVAAAIANAPEDEARVERAVQRVPLEDLPAGAFQWSVDGLKHAVDAKREALERTGGSISTGIMGVMGQIAVAPDVYMQRQVESTAGLLMRTLGSVANLALEVDVPFAYAGGMPGWALHELSKDVADDPTASPWERGWAQTVRDLRFPMIPTGGPLWGVPSMAAIDTMAASPAPPLRAVFEAIGVYDYKQVRPPTSGYWARIGAGGETGQGGAFMLGTEILHNMGFEEGSPVDNLARWYLVAIDTFTPYERAVGGIPTALVTRGMRGWRGLRMAQAVGAGEAAKGTFWRAAVPEAFPRPKTDADFLTLTRQALQRSVEEATARGDNPVLALSGRDREVLAEVLRALGTDARKVLDDYESAVQGVRRQHLDKVRDVLKHGGEEDKALRASEPYKRVAAALEGAKAQGKLTPAEALLYLGALEQRAWWSVANGIDAVPEAFFGRLQLDPVAGMAAPLDVATAQRLMPKLSPGEIEGLPPELRWAYMPPDPWLIMEREAAPFYEAARSVLGRMGERVRTERVLAELRRHPETARGVETSGLASWLRGRGATVGRDQVVQAVNRLEAGRRALARFSQEFDQGGMLVRVVDGVALEAGRAATVILQLPESARGIAGAATVLKVLEQFATGLTMRLETGRLEFVHTPEWGAPDAMTFRHLIERVKRRLDETLQEAGHAPVDMRLRHEQVEVYEATSRDVEGGFRVRSYDEATGRGAPGAAVEPGAGGVPGEVRPGVEGGARAPPGGVVEGRPAGEVPDAVRGRGGARGAAEAGGGAPAAEGEQLPAVERGRVTGTFEPATGRVTLYDGADFGTLLHEDGHFNEALVRTARPDLHRKVVDAFGRDEATGGLTREGQEAAAEAWRWYMRTRLAPNGTLARTFDGIYLTLQDLWARVRGRAAVLPRALAKAWDDEFKPVTVVSSDLARIGGREGIKEFPVDFESGYAGEAARQGRVKAAGVAREGARVSLRRNELLQDLGLKEGEPVAVDTLVAKALAYIKTEQARRLFGTGELVRLSVRTIVPKSRVGRVTDEARNMLIDALGTTPDKLKVKGDRIALTPEQAAGVRQLAQEVAREPMGDIVPDRLLEPWSDLSYITLEEQHALQEAAIDTRAGVAARRSRHAEAVPPTVGYALARVLSDAVDGGAARRMGAVESGKIVQWLRETFIVERPAEGYADPHVQDLFERASREMGQAQVETLRAVRDWLKGGKKGAIVDSLHGARRMLNPPVDPGSVAVMRTVRRLFEKREAPEVASRLVNPDTLAQVGGVLDEMGGRTQRERAALLILQRYADAGVETVLPDEAARRDVADALLVVQEGIERRWRAVRHRGSNIAVAFAGSPDTNVLVGLPDGDLVKLYQWFYSGDWDAILDWMSRKGLDTGVERKKAAGYSVEDALLEALVRMRALDKLEAFAERLVDYGLDTRIEGIAPDEVRNRSEFAQRVLHYINLEVSWKGTVVRGAETGEIRARPPPPGGEGAWPELDAARNAFRAATKGGREAKQAYMAARVAEGQAEATEHLQRLTKATELVEEAVGHGRAAVPALETAMAGGPMEAAGEAARAGLARAKSALEALAKAAEASRVAVDIRASQVERGAPAAARALARAEDRAATTRASQAATEAVMAAEGLRTDLRLDGTIWADAIAEAQAAAAAGEVTASRAVDQASLREATRRSAAATVALTSHVAEAAGRELEGTAAKVGDALREERATLRPARDPDLPIGPGAHHDMVAYTVAHQLLDKFGWKHGKGVWQLFEMPNGEQFLLPDMLVEFMQESLEKAGAVGRARGARATLGLKVEAPLSRVEGVGEPPPVGEPRPGPLRARMALGAKMDEALKLMGGLRSGIAQGLTVGVVIPTPAYFVGNFFGALTQNYMRAGVKGVASSALGEPMLTAAVVRRLWGDGRRAEGTGLFIDRAGRVWTADALADAAQTEGLRSSFIQAETVKALAEDIKRLHEPFWKKMMLAPLWWQRMLMETATASDNYWRVGLWIHELKEGKSPAEAAASARMAGLDYSALTEREKLWGRAFVMFYSYLRRNATLWWDTFLTHPERITGQLRLMNDMNEWFLEEEPSVVKREDLDMRLVVAYRKAAVDTARAGGVAHLAPPMSVADHLGLLVYSYDAILTEDVDGFAMRQMTQRLAPWVQAPVVVAYGVDPFYGGDIEGSSEVPGWLVEADYLMGSPLLLHTFGVRPVTEKDPARWAALREPVTYRARSDPGSSQAKAWWLFRNLGAGLPGLGRGMDTVTRMDRANLGMVEALERQMRLARLVYDREFSDAAAQGKAKVITTGDPVGPRYGMTESDEFWGYLGWPAVTIPRFEEQVVRLERGKAGEIKAELREARRETEVGPSEGLAP